MTNHFDPRFESLPLNPVEYTDRLAHDLAWGVHHGKWLNYFEIKPGWYGERWTFQLQGANEELKNYLENHWGTELPDPKILDRYNYLRELGGGSSDGTPFELTAAALRLPEKKLSASIFISYAREESSAFASLIVARFKELGRVPYLDMNSDRDGQKNKLGVGGLFWPALSAEILKRDNFIVLLGATTLQSKYVCDEIDLAVTNGKHIIPVWHNHFDIKNVSHFPIDLPSIIRQAIKENNGENVLVESPKQYNAAIDVLLAKFGTAP